ncbi:hypothetical protein GEMRC1_004622 [Eukaryota sp. GEM-RC1]
MTSPNFLDVSRPKTLPIFKRFPNAEWLMELDELQYTPSILDGLTFIEEWTERTSAVNFINGVCSQLGLPNPTIWTAIVYFHRFFCRWSLKLYSPTHTVMACIFVASKQCDTSLKLGNHCKRSRASELCTKEANGSTGYN